MKDFQYITNSHPGYIEGLYNDFVKDPNSVEAEMRKFFEGFDFAVTNGAKANGTTVVPAIKEQQSTFDWMSEIRVYRMILGYRNKGHLIADTNPIRKRKDRGANIELDFYGFTETDLEKTFNVGNLIGLGATTLKNIIAHLQKCYTTHLGIEFKYISNQKKIDWLTNAVEKTMLQPVNFFLVADVFKFDT